MKISGFLNSLHGEFDISVQKLEFEKHFVTYTGLSQKPLGQY